MLATPPYPPLPPRSSWATSQQNQTPPPPPPTTKNKTTKKKTLDELAICQQYQTHSAAHPDNDQQTYEQLAQTHNTVPETIQNTILKCTAWTYQ